MSEEKNENFPNKEEEEEVVEAKEAMLDEANENFVEDYHQEQEEGDIEDIDEQADEIGFEDEREADKLTLRKIKEYNEALEDKERVEFYVEYEDKKDLVYITIDKNFTKTNIVSCLQEYIRKLDVLRLKKIELQDGFMEMYLIFQIIKHFTDLEMPKSIENQLIVMERLINTGLIFQIFAEFPKEQIDKLLMEIHDMNETFNENIEEFEKQISQIKASDLQSDIVRNDVQKEMEKFMNQDMNKTHEGEEEKPLAENSHEEKNEE
jgi:hypothetical protein